MVTDDGRTLAGILAAETGTSRTLRSKYAAEQELKVSGLAWTIIACPTAGWARSVFGEPDLERLWQAVETAIKAARLVEQAV